MTYKKYILADFNISVPSNIIRLCFFSSMNILKFHKLFEQSIWSWEMKLRDLDNLPVVFEHISPCSKHMDRYTVECNDTEIQEAQSVKLLHYNREL